MSDNNLTNHFIIAMPSLMDENFSQAVTYICEHDANGTFGIIINRKSDIKMKDVMAQMKSFASRLKVSIPAAEAAGIRIAVENHCDSFSEEILWLLDLVDSPVVGACVDTVNAFMVMEDPMTAIENLAPRAFTNHFRDDRIEFQRYGCKLTGTAVGDGDIDMKRAYEIIRTTSTMRRINIETEMEIPIDSMEVALRMEKETVERSIRYCREVLGIKREAQE